MSSFFLLTDDHDRALIKNMDDCNFDKKTALQWIRSIESSKVSPRDNDIYPMLNSWLAAGGINKVLEIGCGQGICPDKIDLINRTYAGVEPSDVLIERAKELYADDNRSFNIITANPGAYSEWKSFYKEPKIDGKRFEGVMQMPDGSESFDVLVLHSNDEIASPLINSGLKITKIDSFRVLAQQQLHMYISIQGRKV